MLLTANPRIIHLKTIGHRTKGVFDFKPYRTLSKKEITGNATNEPWFDKI
jgi:hydroxymethylglutaryl-CoA synthase